MGKILRELHLYTGSEENTKTVKNKENIVDNSLFFSSGIFYYTRDIYQKLFN